MLDGAALAVEPKIAEAYQYLKTALLSGNEMSGLVYLCENGFRSQWEPLLHHSMIRRNCPVTKLIARWIIISRIMKQDKLAKRLSRVDHRVQIDFLHKLENYVKSDVFTEEIERYQNVRQTLAREMNFGLNRQLVSPKFF